MNPLTDAETRTRLVSVDRTVLDTYSEAVAQLGRANSDATELVAWVEPEQVSEGTWNFGYLTYARVVTDLFAAVHALADSAGFDDLWLEPSHLPESPSAVVELPLIDALAFMVTIWHGERISEGLIANCLENGTLLSAAASVEAALRPTD